MGRQSIRIALTLAGALACGPVLRGQDNSLQWVTAANGILPVGAVSYGNDAQGRPEYVCRGSLGGGTLPGRIGAGVRGCSVGYRGREIILPNYQVLAQPAPAKLAPMRPGATVLGNRAAIESAPVPQPIVPPATAIPPTPPDSSVKRGFDEAGQPYIEVRLPDGTIKRTRTNGVTLTKPDGSTQVIRPGSIQANAPPATPPPLPSDPMQGRMWVERHNAALLDVIRSLVRGEEGEMTKFSTGESAVAGDDVFQQIAYRTKIADFLASER
jgi:hypothetical protein